MDTSNILKELKSERARLDAAIAAIEGLVSGPRASAAPAPAAGRPARRGRRRMSAAARKRIADAQRARWAAHKKQTGESAGKAPAKSASKAKKASKAE